MESLLLDVLVAQPTWEVSLPFLCQSYGFFHSNIDDVNSLKTLKQVRKRGFVGGDHWCNFTEMNIKLLSINTIIIIYFKCNQNTAIQKKHTSKSQKKHPFSSKQNKPHKDLCHLKQLVNAPNHPPPPKNKPHLPWGPKPGGKIPHPTKRSLPPGPPDLKVPTWRLRTTLAPPPLVGFLWMECFAWMLFWRMNIWGVVFLGEYMLKYEKLTLINNPGDSKWPFYPLVGGHLTFEFGSLNHPQKGHNELTHPCTFVRVFWSNVLSEGSRSWEYLLSYGLQKTLSFAPRDEQQSHFPAQVGLMCRVSWNLKPQQKPKFTI